MAVGITLGVIGITISFVISIVGVLLFLVTLVRWMRDTRRDIAELPLDHRGSRSLRHARGRASVRSS